MLGRATLTIPASPSTAVIAEAVATSFAYEAGIPADGVERLQRAIRYLVSFSVEQSYGGESGGDVELSLELDTEGVVVDVHDWGSPFGVLAVQTVHSRPDLKMRRPSATTCG